MRWLAILLLVVSAVPAGAADDPAAPVINALQLSTPPRIDGVLDDRAWSGSSIETGDWRSYNPLHGDTIPQATRVWVAYDADALYFAFQCDDPEPERIKTSVSKRDNIGADDWVGLSLDPTGTGQLSYHMMVNPSGVQLDMLNSVAGNEDGSVDWVWESAGRVTSTGYVVEIRLPLRSLRFSSGDNVRMGLLFWRKVSRIGVSVAWPALEPSKWVFEKHASLHFEHLDPRLPRDVIPSVSVSERQNRATPTAWAPMDQVKDAGISTKFGITTQVTLDATVNPDFSQVESDAFQVDVNQRFPVFYSEKRPFFMEGAGIFSLATTGGGDNSMQRAVHTRRIIDPIAGVKLTGSTGRLTFATLTASDQAPGLALSPTDPAAGRDRIVNVGRAQYSLRASEYVGAIVTDSEFAGRSNRVAGMDLSTRVSTTQRLDAFVLASSTRPADSSAERGVGATLSYNYNTRAMSASGSVEHYSRTFQMDTAFLNRVGITSGWLYGDHNFYPGKGRFAWVRRVTPFNFIQGGEDRIAGGRDLIEVAGARFNFTRLGFLRVDHMWGFEPWAGQRFDRRALRAWGNVQLYRWLKLDGRFENGLAVFYDPTSPFQGQRRRLNGGLVLQPNGRFSQSVSFDHVTFDRKDTGQPVYRVDIINTKTTYQFTRELFLRGIAQYDSSRHRILTDTLLSYELRPGSVTYLGYGSLIEQRGYRDDAWVLGEGKLRESQRGFFAKVSYLLRL
ncbi:MAG: DUF5916 domain-containing protein [Vicinamibacterales bacterium]